MLLHQMPSPQSCATREFEDFAGSQLVAKGRFDDRHLTEPLRTVFRPPVVPPFPEKPFVILGRPSLVVLDLLSKKLAFFHGSVWLTLLLYRGRAVTSNQAKARVQQELSGGGLQLDA